jgi:hypothetical protein
MGLREQLRKAAGLFVAIEPDEEEAAAPLTESPTERPPRRGKTVEEIVREAEGPNLEDVQVPPKVASAILTPDGKLDLAALYSHAQLPTVPFTAEQMLEMLTSLPAELPLEMKRATVKATFNAMGKTIGATPETIVADASRKLAALVAFVDNHGKETTGFLSTSQLEIANLQAKIEAHRKAIESAQRKQAQVTKLCEGESQRLHDVLTFFGQDMTTPPPSKGK